MLKQFCLLIALLLIPDTTFAEEAAKKNPRKPVKIQAPANSAEENNDPSYENEKPSYQSAYSSGRTSRSQVGMELLGSGLLYSVIGSYLVTDQFAVNLGLSYFTISSTSRGLSYSETFGVTQIPFSASYLFGGPDHHFEVLAGGDLLFASSSVSGNGIADKASGSGFIPEFGAGYRYWPSAGGFHFRGTMYAVVIPHNIIIWPGFSFGYAF